MKKTLVIFFMLFSILLVGCDGTFIDPDLINQVSYKEYKDGSELLDSKLFYKATTKEELDFLNTTYSLNVNYDEEFFTDKGLIIFMVTESSGSYTHKLEFSVIADVLYVNYEQVINGGVATDDMAYWIVSYEMNLEILGNIKSVMINHELLRMYEYPIPVAHKVTVFDDYNILINKDEFNNPFYIEGDTVTIKLKFLSGPKAGIKVYGVDDSKIKRIPQEDIGEAYAFTMPDNDVYVSTTLNDIVSNGVINLSDAYPVLKDIANDKTAKYIRYCVPTSFNKFGSEYYYVNDEARVQNIIEGLCNAKAYAHNYVLCYIYDVAGYTAKECCNIGLENGDIISVQMTDGIVKYNNKFFKVDFNISDYVDKSDRVVAPLFNDDVVVNDSVYLLLKEGYEEVTITEDDFKGLDITSFERLDTTTCFVRFTKYDRYNINELIDALKNLNLEFIKEVRPICFKTQFSVNSLVTALLVDENCDPTNIVKKDQDMHIQIGMTFDELVKQIGKPAFVIEGKNEKTYYWYTEYNEYLDVSFNKEMRVLSGIY